MFSNSSVEEDEVHQQQGRCASSIPSSTSTSHRPRSSPSEKARFHYRSTHLSAMSVGKEMSLRDPYYRPAGGATQNPFLTLPRLREGKKIIGSSQDLFSSCFELPSPARVATPTGSTMLFVGDGSGGGGGGGGGAHPKALLAAVASMADCRAESTEEDPDYVRDWGKRSTRSLPSTPTSGSRRGSLDGSSTPLAPMSEVASVLSAQSSSPSTLVSGSKAASSNGLRALRSSASTSRFEDHLFQGRVQLLKRLYSGGTWSTQDDSILVQMSRHQAGLQSYPLRRRGSCESGFYSVGTDDLFANDSGGLSSGRSLGSSLLTVSDLEEDLWAASAFLSGNGKQQHHRTSSIFTDDSADDLDGPGGGVGGARGDERPSSRWAGLVDRGYEKDIRDIVNYFEATCKVSGDYPLQRHHHHHYRARGGPVGVKDAVSSGGYRALWLQRLQEQHQKSTVAPQLPRSPKIESLIKRVVEKESRDRLASRYGARSHSLGPPGATAAAGGSSRLQVCDGIVSSKLPIFDQTKRPTRTRYDQQGLVKSRLAMFDRHQQQQASSSAAAAMSTKKMAERRLARILRQQQQQPLVPKEPVDTGAGSISIENKSSPETAIL